MPSWNPKSGRNWTAFPFIHHGTTIVAYFYRQAVQQAAAEELPEPDEDFYRYKGRKPFTREQAVLMLADCTEGATRAAALSDRNLSRDTIQAIVHGLIEDRVKDGQLDDSPLTFAELRTVEESLIESLVGVYHPRITYPEDPKKKAKEVADAARAELTGTGEPAPAAGSTPAPEREPAPVSRIPHPSTRGPRGGAQPR